MSNFVVFDTSIFIDHLRTGRHQQRIAATTGLVRNSAVVLAELSRGATKPSEKEFAKALEWLENQFRLEYYSKSAAP